MIVPIPGNASKRPVTTRRIALIEETRRRTRRMRNARSTESVAEARARGRSFARSVNEIMRTHRRYKGDDQ